MTTNPQQQQPTKLSNWSLSYFVHIHFYTIYIRFTKIPTDKAPIYIYPVKSYMYIRLLVLPSLSLCISLFVLQRYVKARDIDFERPFLTGLSGTERRGKYKYYWNASICSALGARVRLEFYRVYASSGVYSVVCLDAFSPPQQRMALNLNLNFFENLTRTKTR